MKKWLIVMVSMLFLILGCDAHRQPIYIDRIEIYQDSELLAGTLKYFDGSTWVEYESSTTNQTNVYYSIDIAIGSSINIVFEIYSPDKTINDMKLSLSSDFASHTLASAWATINDREDEITLSNYLIEDVSGTYNVISIYGWLTDQGPKYVGAKSNDVEYILKGVHFNLFP
ncbi:MAG: hypothetical protein PHW40_00515 [Candidatus Izemoplasmatales bacterium]|jgi:uncharacterized protein YcfL|nr:hypothetical protein [Candidatus Izemoplasmatales bacterium]MDD5292776.1 hypothetical protein [Candidatus Izemoplasmatales bacterium]